MALPFLKPRPQTGLMVEVRKPDGGATESDPDNSDDSGLASCSADLIRAIHSKDEAGVSSALKVAFQILDSEPHDEGPHTNEDEQENQ